MSRGTASETRHEYVHVGSSQTSMFVKVSEAVPLLILEVLT